MRRVPLFGLLVCAAAAVLPTVAAAPPSGRAKSATVAAKVAPLDAAGLRKQIAARKGRVVVVNLWATWCEPCKAEFPYLARLQRAYRAKGLDLVTVSFDAPRDVKSKVAPFLRKQGVSAGTFVNRGGSDPDEAYITFLEPELPKDEAFALPRTYVFDRTGRRVKSLTGEQTYADLEKAVAPLLAGTPKR